MRSMRWCVLAALVACGHPPPEPIRPDPPQPDAAVAKVAVGADAAAPSQEEQLAAIQKAMNELAPASQGCWAAAAVERFDIDGELEARITIGGAAGAQVELVRDTTRNAKLGTCVRELLAKYPWAPPLHGQTIQLPFKFRAPDGQSVVDRALVPWTTQGKLAVAVLLDLANTGNEAAAMFELAIAAGGSTGMRLADRAELWYFLGAADVTWQGGKQAVAAGDLMYVPKGGVREVRASADVHAVIVIVPGGNEGAARAGALPNREVTGRVKAPAPQIVHGGKTYCPPKGEGAPPCPGVQATIAIEGKDKPLAASLLELPEGAKVPEHVHAGETELLYMLDGAVTMTVGGVQLPVTKTSVVQIPKGTKHAATATQRVRALQIYTPGGPEQRFKVKS
jgi:quercetin dioxygenase-like cupin family protein